MIKSCQDLQKITIPRPFYPKCHGIPQHQQIYAFADASDLAICYVVYLRTVTSDNSIHVALLCGSTKALPKGVSVKGQLSIPRAELNAARDLAEQVLQLEADLDIADLHPTKYFTDSKDVLAWINNKKDATKRYVTSRINTICKISQPSQWQYEPTEENPADIGTRPITVDELKKSMWVTGPQFLYQNTPTTPIKTEQKAAETVFYTASPKSFFRTTTRHAVEDISTGSMWKRLLEQTQQEHKLPNIRKTTDVLKRRCSAKHGQKDWLLSTSLTHGTKTKLCRCLHSSTLTTV